jgi:phage terminase large subunit
MSQATLSSPEMMPGGSAWDGLLAVNGQVVYKPTPKQLQFHLCPARYVLYGGAVAGGKSHALRWHAYMSCLSVPKFKVLLLRRYLTELERTHCRKVAEEQHLFGAKWVKSEYILNFPNGSWLELGHCQHEDDANIYLSAEYDLILFDELVTFTETQYRKIRSRCRTTIPGVTPRVMAGTNPGGSEAAWVRRMWVEKDLTEEEDPYYNPVDYAYIPARLEDNPHINREAYELELQGLPPELARAYREGDWNIFYGQYFQEFRKSLHVADLGTVAPTARRICGLDYGYSREGVCLWGVILPEGQLYIEDEYTFNGQRRKKQIASQVALALRKRSDDRGITVGGCYADPDIFSPSGHTGETIAETFGRYGWPMLEADNDRINGWARVRAWLGLMPRHESWDHDKPWMVISPKCIGLVRTLPQLVMDPRRPEDVNTESPDHWGDALRYLVMSRPAPNATEIPEPSYAEGTMGWMRQQILSGHRNRDYGRLGRRAVRRYAY